MRLAKKLSAKALFLALLFAAASCTPSQQTAGSLSQLATIRQEHAIRVGWAPYAPYSSLDPATKKPQGFYIDLVADMARESGLKVEWVETTWGTMISDLKAQKFQFMGSPVFRTIPRALEVAFTRPIDFFGYSAIVRKGDSRFKNIEDLDRSGVRIAVTQGEVGHEFAQRHLPKAELIVHKTGDIALALVDVIQGKADAGICDAWTAKQFAAEHKDTVEDLFATRPFNVVGAGWFAAQDQSDLLQFLNTSIDWAESSGELRRIASTYNLPSFFGADSRSQK
jgi:ABC-type amino acid transport substrate-binding protein